MTQGTQRKNVRTTIDKIDYWKVSAKLIRYAGVESSFTCGEITDLAKQRALGPTINTLYCSETSTCGKFFLFVNLSLEMRMD